MAMTQRRAVTGVRASRAAKVRRQGVFERAGRTLVETKTPGNPSNGSNPDGGTPIWSFFGHSMAYHHRHSSFCARKPLLVS